MLYVIRDLPCFLRRFSFSSLLSMALISSWLLHPFPMREKLGSCDGFSNDSLSDISLVVSSQPTTPFPSLTAYSQEVVTTHGP